MVFSPSYSGVSVIICCYNGKDRLPELLRHLALQRADAALDWEIILVDNASTDNTTEVARREWEKRQSPVPLVILHQPVPGKTAALEMGYRAARYEFLLICDDDNWLSPGYVQRAYDLISANGTIGALGGKGIAGSDGPLPPWFEQFRSCYAVGPQATNRLPPEERCLYGAGMVIRKAVYEEIARRGLGYQLSCRIGAGVERIIGGGDTEFCFLLTLLNYKLVYDESLQFTHYIPPDRLTLGYLHRLHKGYHVTVPLLSPYVELIRASHRNRQARKYFWTLNLGAALGATLYHACLLAVSAVTGRNRLVNKMNFVFNRGVASYYLKYNFRLSRKLAELRAQLEAVDTPANPRSKKTVPV